MHGHHHALYYRRVRAACMCQFNVYSLLLICDQLLYVPVPCFVQMIAYNRDLGTKNAFTLTLFYQSVLSQPWGTKLSPKKSLRYS